MLEDQKRILEEEMQTLLHKTKQKQMKIRATICWQQSWTIFDNNKKNAK